MAATDHETLLIERLWAILEAHTAFTDLIPVGNRVKLFGSNPTDLKIHWSNAPKDFPEVTIGAPQINDTLYTLGERFAMGPAGAFNPATSGVACDITFGMVIDIIHRDANFIRARLLNNETMTAIRKSGPNLTRIGAGTTALAFRVQRVGPALATSRIVQGRFGEYGDAGGPRRIATSISLPVLVRAQTSDLLA